MSARNYRRILRFEKLEQKASPCSLLLLAPHPGGATEPSEEKSDKEVFSCSIPSIAFHWRCEHSTQGVLQFIHDNTASADAGELPQPSDSDSATADDMMKFDDTELRSLITFPGMKSGSGGI